jgi:hemoglobin
MTMSTCAGPDTAAEADEISFYEAIGGRPALVAAVDLFYRRILADPELSPFFPGGVGDRHRAYLITFLGQALGGPSRYHGRDMATAHHGLGITNAHFDRVAGHLQATLDELGVPGELTARIVGIAAGLRPAVVTT